MTQNEVLEKYYSRLETEGMLKAVFSGFAAGFLCYFLITFITWFTSFDGLILAFGVGEAVCWLSIPAFYFFLFKPTDKDVAKRLDQLGLEERFLTMVAYQNETGGIYELQRRDAVAALNKVDVKSIKLVISPILIILLACSLVLGTGMTVVHVKTGGTVETIVTPTPPVEEEPAEPFVEEVYYTVTYKVVLYMQDSFSFVDNIGGYVTGGNTQVVKVGQDAATVTAVADEGFGFAGWMDTLEEDSQSATRTDTGIQEDVEYVAIFMLSENGGGGGGGNDSDDNNNDNKNDNNNNNENNNDDDIDGEETIGSNGPVSPPVDIQGNNQVIDGNTYYGDVVSAYYEMAMQQLANGTLTDEMRAFIQQYYGIII